MKGAQTMIRISKLENPPIRIPLGSDAVERVKWKARKVLEELDAFEEISRSCSGAE